MVHLKSWVIITTGSLVPEILPMYIPPPLSSMPMYPSCRWGLSFPHPHEGWFLKVMGYNYYGQLGTGNTSNVYSPTAVIDANVSQIAAGSYHSLILMEDGSLKAMGNNYQHSYNDPSSILGLGFYQVTFPVTLFDGNVSESDFK